MKLSLLPDEPNATSPEVCTISFRLPTTGERLTRRFLKTDKVQLLYDYLDSLDDDKLQFETPGCLEYVIMQNIPKKEFKERERMLGEVGLYPRAML